MQHYRKMATYAVYKVSVNKKFGGNAFAEYF